MSGTSTVRVKVEAGWGGVVAHVGLHALGHFADRLGLGSETFSQCVSRSVLSGVRCITVGRCSFRSPSCSPVAARAAPTSNTCPAGRSCSATCRRTRRCTGPSTRSVVLPVCTLPRRSPRCAPRSGNARQPRPSPARCTWTSTPRSSRFTRRTRPRLHPPTPAWLRFPPALLVRRHQ